MTAEEGVVPCAACGKPIKKVRLFYGHMERQPVGTVHYARPKHVRTTGEAEVAVPLGSAPSASPVARRVLAAGMGGSRNGRAT